MLTPQAGIQVDKFYPPTDWLDNDNEQIDIRKNAEDNTIVLLVGHSADFTKYSLLGLYASVSSGTYDVYIDDVLVGSGITSGTQYDIDFSTIATSYGSATTPEALVLHKVVVKPTTNSDNITWFMCRRTSSFSSTQYHGVLWLHYEISNEIRLSSLFNYANNYYNHILYAVTAKNDTILSEDMESSFRGTHPNLEYLPLLKSNSSFFLYNFGGQSGLYRLKRLRLNAEQDITSNTDYFLNYITNLEQIVFNKELRILGATTSSWYKLKVSPKIYKASSTNIYISSASSLYPTKFDFSDIENMTRCNLNGNASYPSTGIKGLKVSKEAPFSGAEPQINISYTGLDRDALVELFNSLPYNVGYITVGSPAISDGVVSGFTTSDYLRLEKLPDFSENVELVIKFKSSTFSGKMVSWITGGKQCFVMFNANKTINVFFSAMGDNTTHLTLNGNYVFSENTYYYVKIIKTEDNSLISYYSTDGTNYTLDNESQNTNAGTVTLSSYFRWGVSSSYTPTDAFDGEIDFNKTYVKTNGILFFRGTSATTKSINLVGATGTSDLTADDKAIATDKGWSLILS